MPENPGKFYTWQTHTVSQQDKQADKKRITRSFQFPMKCWSKLGPSAQNTKGKI